MANKLNCPIGNAPHRGVKGHTWRNPTLVDWGNLGTKAHKAKSTAMAENEIANETREKKKGKQRGAYLKSD